MNAQPTNWGLVTRSIHWITALAVPSLYALGSWMMDLDYYSEWYRTAPHIHKSIGILLAILTLVRIVWLFKRDRPAPLGSPWEIKLAKLGHMAIYLLLIAIFISGYLISTADGRAIDVFNWFAVPSMGELFAKQEDIAGDIHELLALGLISLVVVHLLAALKHHFIDKDQTLIRMLKK